MSQELEEIFSQPPHQVVEFTDPKLGCRGWLVRDTADYAICAGGMRVQAGLTLEQLSRMARNMTLKMRISGLRVDGAKCGIDLDPASPHKERALTQFMKTIRPFLESSYSMGPDLNVEMAELDRIARSIGIPSVKMAVAKAQSWELDYYLERAAILNQEINGWSVNRLRAGYGVSAAAQAVLDHLGIAHHQARVAIQGFGTLAKATAHGLSAAGVSIIALADRDKSLIARPGKKLNIELLSQTTALLIPEQNDEDAEVRDREDIVEVPCDLFIPAAVENTITRENSHLLKVQAVVPGANLGVSKQAAEALNRRGVLVLPDFVSGCGGSLSMEGLFGPKEHPAPDQVLHYLHNRMKALTEKILVLSAEQGISPTRTALQLCRTISAAPGSRTYTITD